MSKCCVPSNGSRSVTTTERQLSVGALQADLKARAVHVPGGRTFVGTQNADIPRDGESPRRQVSINDFWIDPLAVTNSWFRSFVETTGHETDAERLGWSAVFAGTQGSVDEVRSADGPWWVHREGASWRAPEGTGSDIADRWDHPVVHVSWNDARAFCAWAGGRLPTEAEWEHAARGGDPNARFPWGDAEPSDEDIFCNIWQGSFPHSNTVVDDYDRTAPARSFQPNPFGLFNMSGNVWEWCSDAYKVRSVSAQAKQINAAARKERRKVLKGGSFLCHRSYCYRYRIAARSGASPADATSHIGFRVVFDA